MSLAWGLTGAGHYLKECIELIREIEEVDVFLSRACEEVVGMYRLADKLPRPALIRDTLACSPSAGRFSSARYRALIIAPATSNSVAKFVCGISDSLITNLFAQAGKSSIPVVVLPTDVAPEADSITPVGKRIKVYPRPVDLQNTAALRRMSGVTVTEDIEGLRRCLAPYL